MSAKEEGEEITVTFRRFIQQNVALPVAAMNALVTKIKVRRNCL